MKGDVNWVSDRDEFSIPAALKRGEAAKNSQLFTSSLYSQVVAARHGIGTAILPCFIGDVEPGLVRDGAVLDELQQDLWIVYHVNLSGSVRVRATLDFLSNLVAANRELIEGRRPAT